MLDTDCQPNSKTFLSFFGKASKEDMYRQLVYNWHALENAFGMMGPVWRTRLTLKLKIYILSMLKVARLFAVYNFITNKSPVIYYKKLAKALFRTDVPEIKDPPSYLLNLF